MSQKLNTAIAVAGIDIGKSSFHVVGLDKRGAIVLRQKWSRGQVEARFANMPPCLIGMEACVGAHHLSRKLSQHRRCNDFKSLYQRWSQNFCSAVLALPKFEPYAALEMAAFRALKIQVCDRAVSWNRWSSGCQEAGAVALLPRSHNSQPSDTSCALSPRRRPSP
jgi:hypothetical protein